MALKTHGFVETPDHVRVSVTERGRRDGPAIVFIHGFSQSSLVWKRQFEGSLADYARLIAYDLRGHGFSDKPTSPDAFRSPKCWAGELDAVLRATDAPRPLLVAWSFGGRVACDYLAVHGDSKIAGLCLVSAVTCSEAKHFGSKFDPSALTTDDLLRNVDVTRAFVRSLFYQPLEGEEFERWLVSTAMCPRDVRGWMLGRDANYREVLKHLAVSTLVIHGECDQVILSSMSEQAAALIPRSLLRIYPDVGHAPFWEASKRFDSDLAAFAKRVHKR